jgi:hypothetical protein
MKTCNMSFAHCQIKMTIGHISPAKVTSERRLDIVLTSAYLQEVAAVKNLTQVLPLIARVRCTK